jgi:chromate reductase, NAD(P)H dehydrogenase (quinone)
MKTTNMKTMKVVIVNGTVRPGNYTSMASALVADELRKHEGLEVRMIHPVEYGLVFPGEPGGEGMNRLRKEMREADAVVLATPEYNGGLSSVMKAVIENLEHPSALAGKPVALLGVAAGAIGAIKSLEMLRSIASHVGAVVLPQAVSVASVQTKFSPDGKVLDADMEKTVRSLATSLVRYLHDAVRPKRELARLAERAPLAATIN